MQVKGPAAVQTILAIQRSAAREHGVFHSLEGIFWAAAFRPKRDESRSGLDQVRRVRRRLAP